MSKLTNSQKGIAAFGERIHQTLTVSSLYGDLPYDYAVALASRGFGEWVERPAGSYHGKGMFLNAAGKAVAIEAMQD